MIKKIDVFANKIKVGTLALTNDNRVAFQYSKEWVRKGFSINPFKLPLSEDDIYISKSPYFDGLFGVFADSLPDSYGNLLLDRFLKSKKIDISSLTVLDRLAYVGSSGMGMLEYVPDLSEQCDNTNIDFDSIQKECDALLSSKEVKDIENLFSLGGSSGGARPKSLIRINEQDFIVKFSSRFDPKNIAEIEYNTMLLAKECGINIPHIRLAETITGQKYFLIKRFDRDHKKRIHMISVAALLETDFRAPSLDYKDLLKLTFVLTKNSDDVFEMFRRMVFNVLIDNQDDHAKNFAFIYDFDKRTYRLSPAYDLTPGKTYYGEHTTSVNGKGKNITDDDMLKVAEVNHIDLKKAKSEIDRIKKIIDSKKEKVWN